MVLRATLWLPVLLTVGLCGCNPVHTAVKLGMHVVGQVVDDEETNKLGQQLMGKSPADADATLGKRLDVLRDVHSPREWLVYPVKLDVLGSKRYVVEVSQNQIVGVQMVVRNSGETDIPLKLYYEAKAKGKAPQECEAALGLGPPMLTVRSLTTGQLGQVYDARLVKELPKPHYCVLKFDSGGLCTQVDLVEVAATANSGP